MRFFTLGRTQLDVPTIDQPNALYSMLGGQGVSEPAGLKIQRAGPGDDDNHRRIEVLVRPDAVVCCRFRRKSDRPTDEGRSLATAGFDWVETANGPRKQLSVIYVKELRLDSLSSLSVDRLDHLEAGVMKIKHIESAGAVVENNHGQIVATVNKGLVAQDLKEVAEAFALVRGEIAELTNVPERDRARAGNAIKEAEDEVAAADRNPDVVKECITRAKQTLEATGETWDRGKKWCSRLADLGTALAKIMPAAAVWVKAILP